MTILGGDSDRRVLVTALSVVVRFPDGSFYEEQVLELYLDKSYDLLWRESAKLPWRGKHKLGRWRSREGCLQFMDNNSVWHQAPTRLQEEWMKWLITQPPNEM